MRIPLPLRALLLFSGPLLSFTPLFLPAQISNPIPEPIERGDLTLGLETYATVPPSASGQPRARISALRELPDGRFFVNDQRGKISRITGGTATTYLDVETVFSRFIDSPGLGTGLQSFAFHPDFRTNGKFYTTHTEPWNAPGSPLKGPAPITSAGHQGVVTEWTASDPSANTFSGTHRELFRVAFPGTVHGLQEITFNPNAKPGDADYGMLYVCVGEGGSYLKGLAYNDHRLDSPMGTIFRIDPFGTNAGGGAYGIPLDNPWADSTDPSVLKEIFAYGFRNPHRLSWDVGGDHLALVGDIGERNLEELNILLPGHDYGFPEREGTFLLQPDQPEDNYDVFPLPADDAQYGYTYPVAQYDHDEGFAIMGGYVYRGSELPTLQGIYVFGDIKNGSVLYVNVDDLALGQQATIREATLTVNGAEVTLQSLVGGSRADLRFGVDRDNELYILTKTDGVIRKIVGVSNESPTTIDSNPDDWSGLADFEDGLGAVQVERANGDSAPEVVNDPYGDSSNHVLALSGAGTAITADLVPPVGADAPSALFFRFSLENAHSGLSAGATDSSVASSANQLQTELRARGDGSLAVRDGFSLSEVATNLRSGVWYEAWMFFDGKNEESTVYVRGGDFTAPALLASGFRAKLPTVGNLVSFLVAVDSEAAASSRVYLDDFNVDYTGFNLSSPIPMGWSVVENFETVGALNDWTFLDVDEAEGAAAEDSFQWLTEPSGNAFLRVRATPTDNVTTMAMVPLPSPIQVGENITLYGRMRPDSEAVNVVWGLGNVDEETFGSVRYDALETILRYTNENDDPLLIRDDTNYVAASGSGFVSPRAGQWYEFWIVARNGGEASGGQTFDVYWRPDRDDSAPVRIASDAGFRIARELPLTRFSLLANHGSTTATGSVSFDDLQVIPGEVLERPNGTGIGLFPGPRGNKSIPWFGLIWDGARPWVYHAEHKWVYIPENQYDGLWMYDTRLGWLYTNPGLYPNIYSATAAEWLFYAKGTRDPRWFYGRTRDAWFTDEE